MSLNNLVAVEHQYLDVIDPPLDAVRMAWPFKTDEERELIRKWFKKHHKDLKKKQVQDHIAAYGEAFL